MKPFLTPEATAANAASIESILAAAGAHQWTDETVHRYMEAEAKKLKPNWLYYVAKCLPSSNGHLGDRIEMAITMTFAAGLIGGFGCIVASAVLKITNLGVAAGYVSPLFFTGIAGMAIAAGILALFINNLTLKVMGHGRWREEDFAFVLADEYGVTEEIMERIRTVKAMLPDARLEISLLYHEQWLCDPVLWLITGEAGAEARRAILVWDERGNIILPH